MQTPPTIATARADHGADACTASAGTQAPDAAQRAQLAWLSQVQASLLESLSHDLSEPLRVLALNAELLLHRSASAPDLLHCATRLKAAAGLLQRHVDHLVHLAKAPRPALHLCRQRIDLAQLAHDRWHVSVGLGRAGAAAGRRG